MASFAYREKQNGAAVDAVPYWNSMQMVTLSLGWIWVEQKRFMVRFQKLAATSSMKWKWLAMARPGANVMNY